MGVLAPRLRRLDGPLVPPSTRAEICRCTCLQSLFYEIFYFPTFIHTIFYSLIVLYSPLFGSFSANPSLLPYAMHCVALVFVDEGLALCHHLGTRALDPSSVLDYWLPAENMFMLDFYCA